ncbi:hypothetical protein NLI96_g1329 [Meripilus lineatus]|uniref:Uncharacterized protein n=1 Tax=Meripilus lineatus TaxID=2056292 RepID=A0AAD5YII4_9APHY|nr:hypothetical protein NLI96_g1329 [Physisporinus lineatus]
MKDLAQLARLPKLSLLTLKSLSEESGAFNSSTSPTVEFQSLSELSISYPSKISPLGFLEACRFPVLKSFAMFCENPTSLAFLGVLVEHCRPALLKSLRFYVSPRDLPPDGAIDTADLLALLRFQALTYFSLNLISYEANINDTFLKEMSQAWPQLQELHIEAPNRSPMFTLAGLIPLASNCRHLTSLSISLDGQDPPSPHVGGSYRGTRNFCLQELRLYSSSPIRTHEGVTTFLSNTFPGLQRIELSSSWDYVVSVGHRRAITPDLTKWEQVAKSLRVMANARNDRNDRDRHSTLSL